MSLPAEKHPSVPRNAIARMAGSVPAAVSASVILAYIWRVMAFFFSGRLNRMS